MILSSQQSCAMKHKADRFSKSGFAAAQNNVAKSGQIGACGALTLF